MPQRRSWNPIHDHKELVTATLQVKNVSKEMVMASRSLKDAKLNLTLSVARHDQQTPLFAM